MIYNYSHVKCLGTSQLCFRGFSSSSYQSTSALCIFFSMVSCFATLRSLIISAVPCLCSLRHFIGWHSTNLCSLWLKAQFLFCVKSLLDCSHLHKNLSLSLMLSWGLLIRPTNLSSSGFGIVQHMRNWTAE